MKRIAANGVELAYVDEGDGPVVLLTHGFPDTAHTWDRVRPALAAAGYRAVTPNLRGYHPSTLAADGRYDVEMLGRDALALLDGLGVRQAILVGHDWGAVASYVAAALAPERVKLLVTVAVAHPAAIRPTLKLAWAGRHFARFRLPGGAAALRADDFAYVDRLVRRWSPRWQVPEGAFEHAKRSLSRPGAAEAAVAMYRQLSFRPTPALRARISVPTVAFAGESDGGMTPELFDRARSRFTGPYEVVRLAGGHFLHLEEPDRFAGELLAAIGRHS